MLALKSVPDWFVTTEVIQKLDNAAISNDNVDSDIATFFSNDIGLNSINLNNINVDDDNFDNCDPETFSHVTLNTWYNRFKQLKACKKKMKS